MPNRTVVISTQNFPPHTGGIQNYLYELAKALSDGGNEVVVFCDAGKHPDDKTFDQQLKFSVRRIRGPKFLRRYRKARQVSRFLATHKSGLLICDTWKSLETLQPQTMNGWQTACIGHGMEFPLAPSAQKHRRICETLDKADWLLPNSQFTATRMTPFCNQPEKLQLLPPGVGEAAEPSPAALKRVEHWCASGHPILVTLGRLEPRKGQDYLVQILPELLQSHPTLRYLIAGSGPSESSLRQSVGTLGLSDHVIFCGRVSDEEKTALLQKSDVFVMPCRIEGVSVEGFGIVYIEAALQGKPSIAGQDGGASDAVLDGETGLICDGSDQQSILRAVQRLLNDRELRDQLGQAAQQRAQRELTWPIIAQRLLTLCDTSRSTET